jgi:hypothetical protein
MFLMFIVNFVIVTITVTKFPLGTLCLENSKDDLY